MIKRQRSTLTSLYRCLDIFKLKYTVAKNRFCENIGRQHKSNGIIIEADLTRGYLSQMCFDPDCRGEF